MNRTKRLTITIGGFILGPLSAFVISVIVSFIEMLSVSETGLIGCIMNIISTCSFACTASIIYKKKHNIKGAIIGLLSGCVLMVIEMLLWNYCNCSHVCFDFRDISASIISSGIFRSMLRIPFFNCSSLLKLTIGIEGKAALVT